VILIEFDVDTVSAKCIGQLKDSLRVLRRVVTVADENSDCAHIKFRLRALFLLQARWSTTLVHKRAMLARKGEDDVEAAPARRIFGYINRRAIKATFYRLVANCD